MPLRPERQGGDPKANSAPQPRQVKTRVPPLGVETFTTAPANGQGVSGQAGGRARIAVIAPTGAAARIEDFALNARLTANVRSASTSPNGAAHATGRSILIIHSPPSQP